MTVTRETRQGWPLPTDPVTVTRETRQGWPLPTVETEVNGDSEYKWKGSFLGFGSLGCRAGTRDFCHSLAALVGPVQNIFSLPYTLFQFICPHCPASWAFILAWSPVLQYVSLTGTAKSSHSESNCLTDACERNCKWRRQQKWPILSRWRQLLAAQQMTVIGCYR